MVDWKGRFWWWHTDLGCWVDDGLCVYTDRRRIFWVP